MSGIYINRLGMPKKGTCKTITIFDDGSVVEGNGSEKLGIAVPVPEHGDLIDRDALRASIGESIEECHKWADEVDKDTMMYARISQSLGTFVECSLRAKAAPTIIPAYPAKEGET